MHIIRAIRVIRDNPRFKQVSDKNFTHPVFGTVLTFSEIYAIIIAAVSEMQSKRKEQPYGSEKTRTFILQEKAGKSVDCVVSNFTRGYSDFSVENERYYFVV